MLPYLGSEAPAFAFLIHFRDASDIDLFAGTAFLRKYSRNEDDLLRKVTAMPPLVTGDVSFGMGGIHGDLVCTMRMPHDMAGADGARVAVEAARVAVARGVQVIGLGALTSPATGSGERLAAVVPVGVTVTTGNAYTAAVVRSNVQEVCRLKHITHPKVGVVGCTGSVGVAASVLLAEIADLILVGRSASRVRSLLGGLASASVVTDRLDALAEADVVVMLTHDSSAHVVPAHLRRGAVVIDVAQPPNVNATRHAAFSAYGVDVVAGGLVRIPQYHSTLDFLADRRATFACLAETYLFAMEGCRAHAVGRADAAQSRAMERMAAKHGITPVSLAPGLASRVEPRLAIRASR